MPYANNKGADQPAHPCSLISTFVIRSLDNITCTSFFYIRNFKPLASLYSCAGRFESYLVANPEDRFSRDEAHMDRDKRIWYLSPMRAAKVQASLRIRAVSPEPPLLAHTSIESRGTFRQKARSLAPLNGWACAVKICNDGMLEDTNSLDGAHIKV